MNILTEQTNVKMIAPPSGYKVNRTSNPSVFRLNDVIADAISIISRVATFKGIQVIFEPNHEAIAYADQDMIYAKTYDLVFNSVKFAHRGETVKISPKIDRDKVKISVSNSGTGYSYINFFSIDFFNVNFFE